MEEQNINHLERIYLDYQASTPCTQPVVEAMLPYFNQIYGNPHARSHQDGWSANDALEIARLQVAKAINATEAQEIIFTSGATESNNLAIKGLGKFWQKTKNHIITSKMEHKCMFEAIQSMEREGFTVTYLDVNEQGLLDAKAIEAAIQPNTLCVAISAVNHEIGTIQDMESIGKITRKHKVFFIVDAAQALGKIQIDVQKWQADLVSLSAHKTYGPKGIGALFVRTKPNRIRIKPLQHGGGQERGMRSGTTPVTLAVGFGKACELYANKEHIDAELKRISELHTTFLDSIMKLDHIYLNGPWLNSGKRIPHNINISVAGIEGESLMMEMPNLSFSSGSACTSANLEPSQVLRAIGVMGPKEDLLHSSVRISFGQGTSLKDIEQACVQFNSAITTLREMSPVWEDIITNGVKY